MFRRCPTTRETSCATVESSQSNQPTQIQRTGQPVVGTDSTGHSVVRTDPKNATSGRKTTRSQEVKTLSFQEEAVKHDGTEQPVVICHINNVSDGCQTRSSHESTSFNVGNETIHDRTGQPVVNRDESGHEHTMPNEVNMDFRIPGLPQERRIYFSNRKWTNQTTWRRSRPENIHRDTATTNSRRWSR